MTRRYVDPCFQCQKDIDRGDGRLRQCRNTRRFAGTAHAEQYCGTHSVIADAKRFIKKTERILARLEGK